MQTQLSRPAVESSAIEMMAKVGGDSGNSYGKAAKVDARARPLSPGSNCTRQPISPSSALALCRCGSRRTSHSGGVFDAAH